MAEVESFVFYTSWLDAIQELENREDQLDALFAIMNYQAYHIEPSEHLEGIPKAIFKMAKPVADSLYSRRQANVENGKKGGRPKKAQSGEEPEDKASLMEKENPKKPIGYSEKNLYENENDNGNENEKRVNKRFAKPSIDEIKSYCQERKNGIDADRFFNYYESNGWRVGKNPMKDWKAAVRTWEQNSPKPQIEERKVLDTW